MKSIRNPGKTPSPFPLETMMASRIDEPFTDPEWIYELKLVGL